MVPEDDHAVAIDDDDRVVSVAQHLRECVIIWLGRRFVDVGLHACSLTAEFARKRRLGHAVRLGVTVAPMSWEMVDEGWGRKAVDFATMAEPTSCREYVFVHTAPRHRDRSDRVLDVACGSGLAIELARMRGVRLRGSTRRRGWWPSPATGTPTATSASAT